VGHLSIITEISASLRFCFFVCLGFLFCFVLIPDRVLDTFINDVPPANITFLSTVFCLARDCYAFHYILDFLGRMDRNVTAPGYTSVII